ncbi:MAG: DUF4384 domain-containing protein [Proteobacteria bacterium]|nr:DUF4384 domain-containing protein [Pseudomonadota bacterium]
MRKVRTIVAPTLHLCLYLCLALALPAIAFGAPKQPVDARHQAFRKIAQKIILELNEVRRVEVTQGKMDKALAYLHEAYNYVRPERMRIAVAPFDQDDIMIDKAVADEFNDSLSAALIQNGDNRYDLMARTQLKALITDMQQTGAWEAADGNPINALLQNAGKIDVLIHGKIRVTGQTAYLSYTAIDMGGRLVAQVGRQAFQLSPEDAKIRQPTFSLDGAIQIAARHLIDQTSGLEELLLGGIRFENTGAQPPFGQYVQGRLSAAIQLGSANLVTGKTIRVSPLLAHSGLESGRSVRVEELRDQNLGGNAAAYVLRGTYWELPDAIELRLQLNGPKGSSSNWIGWIRPDDNAGRRMRPIGDFGSLRDYDGVGPFAFQLTSDRGKNAAYRLGEKMKLLLRLDRKAWVYCFYRDAAGATMQILPNPHFWQTFEQPSFDGGVLYTVPNDQMFNFDFTVSPPIGQELVKCFAVSRDVTAELPPALQGKTLAPLPRDLGMQLSPTFRRLPDAAVSEASFVVTVAE